jgi:hypothetical protein
MNIANLQLEGLLITLAQLLRELRGGEGFDRGRVEAALLAAEAAILADRQRMAQLSPSERESVLFPCRFLAAALAHEDDAFSGLAKKVGQTKDDGPTEGLTRALLDKR